MLSLMLSIALATPPEAETIRVPVAAHTLHPGQRIATTDVELVTYLPAYIPSDVAITDVADASGRVVRETIYPGELLRRERLTERDAPDGPAGVVPRGMQVLRLEPTLPAPPISPASYVDILDGSRSCVVVEAVRVLGVEGSNGRVETARTPDATVAWHLAVLPDQAPQILALSSYTLAIRHETDVTSVPEVLCAPAAQDHEPVEDR